MSISAGVEVLFIVCSGIEGLSGVWFRLRGKF